MMIPVQEIIIQTKEKRNFDVYIEKHSDDNFKWNLYYWDPKVSFYRGYSTKDFYKSAVITYGKMLDFIITYLNQRNDNDSIEFIDNPCNCELIDLINQKDIVSKAGQSFPVKINGK